MKVIIVGGVAGGASCAARLRRLDEKAEILMVERGPYVSYANCGLPYQGFEKASRRRRPPAGSRPRQVLRDARSGAEGKVRLSRHQRDVAHHRERRPVLKGLAESRSDGIIQVSTGGAAFASGSAVKDMLLGAVSIAEHVHRVAGRYPR